MYIPDDNIIALSTPGGVGALAVIRFSGVKVINIADKLFSKNILNSEGYSLHYGFISHQQETLDEVMLSVFRAPKSFTGENMVEISSHGSPIVVNLIIEAFLSQPKVRLAEPGEFSLRAYQNKKIDLIKAESIADLIASESKAAHNIAINQLRNGFSKKMETLRQELVDFAALLELELDFGEEDVEFAKRDKLIALCKAIKIETETLASSFKYGNVIKNGIQTAIVGKPNAGKSTLLNCLLNDERAIVSNIAGTTRDTIEEKWTVDGVLFNLIDTAGLRENSTDEIEIIGIERTKKAIEKASLILLVIDGTDIDIEETNKTLKQLKTDSLLKVIPVINKADEISAVQKQQILARIEEPLFVAAKNADIDDLNKALQALAKTLNLESKNPMISNLRHLHALQNASAALDTVIKGIDNNQYIDQIASDLKEALFHLGAITGGSISADEVLSSVFSRFCIGK